MKNSIKYKLNNLDIMLQSPYGVAVVAIPSKTIIYSRIFIWLQLEANKLMIFLIFMCIYSNAIFNTHKILGVDRWSQHE